MSQRLRHTKNVCRRRGQVFMEDVAESAVTQRKELICNRDSGTQ